MSIYDSVFYKIYCKVLGAFAGINWNKIKAKLTGRRYYNLTDQDHEVLRSALSSNYYIILTRRANYVSTYLISFANLVKTGKFSHYSHVLMNLEGDDPVADGDYQIFESTGAGVHLSSFMDVFNCDSVCLLRPKDVSHQNWIDMVDDAKAQIGKPYDDWFMVNDDTHLSCVELVRNMLRTLPDYETRFANFEADIARVGNLTPEMFYNSPDFEKVLEFRR